MDNEHCYILECMADKSLSVLPFHLVRSPAFSDLICMLFIGLYFHSRRRPLLQHRNSVFSQLYVTVISKSDLPSLVSVVYTRYTDRLTDILLHYLSSSQTATSLLSSSFHFELIRNTKLLRLIIAQYTPRSEKKHPLCFLA